MIDKEPLYPAFYDNIKQVAFIKIDAERLEIEIPYLAWVQSEQPNGRHFAKRPVNGKVLYQGKYLGLIK